METQKLNTYFYQVIVFIQSVQLYIIPYFPDATTFYAFKYYPKVFYLKETSFMWQSGNATTFHSHRKIGQVSVLTTVTLLSWLTSLVLSKGSKENYAYLPY